MSVSLPVAVADPDDVAVEPSDSVVSPLEVLRLVDFDWTLHLASVWTTPQFDVDGLHADVRRELLAVLDDLSAHDEPRSPLGRVIVGSGGTGKTHLLSVLRHEATGRGCSFVLVDLSAVRDFSATVLQGLVDSLGRVTDGPDSEQPQYRTLLARLLSQLKLAEPVSRSLDKLERFPSERLRQNCNLLLTVLSRQHSAETRQFQDALRALLALNSRDIEISSLGLKWLQASELEPEERQLLGFTRSVSEPFEIVRAMSWLMSLCGPTVFAFDQLDPIVHQLQLSKGHADEQDSLPQSVLAARSIVEQIAGGLSTLRDVTRRTLLVVSCVEATLDVLRRHALRQDLERFDSPLMLGSLPDDTTAQSVIARRLNAAFERTGFEPPWPTWPFRPELFEGLQGVSPREILRLCAGHRRQCLLRGEVVELSRFDADDWPAVASATTGASSPGGDSSVQSPQSQTGQPASELATELQAIDTEFDRLQREARLPDLLGTMNDDTRLGPLLQTACRCLIHERTWPHGVDAGVETDFGNTKLPPLHARLRVMHGDGTERHLCLRALQRDNATAFQTRLKAALTASGIAADLPFRRLVIIRRGDPPSGPVTEQLLAEFHAADGRLLSPTDDELRQLAALHTLESNRPTGFTDWLKQRRPVTSLDGFCDLTDDW